MKAHRARKRFGQNFLIDETVIEQIIELIDPSPGEHILEIGPGQGALTEHLIRRSTDLTVVEIDRDLAAELGARFASVPHFKMLNTDALTIKIAELAGADQYHVVGNLPYNVSTPLLVHLLSQIKLISRMTFMLQKEVVERMCAAAGTPNYGRLSVLVQSHCEPKDMLPVPPSAFVPSPKVESSVVQLWPLSAQLEPNLTLGLQDLTRSAFSQRRKMVKRGLAGILSEQELEDQKIDAKARPGEITVQQYIELTRFIAARDSQ